MKAQITVTPGRPIDSGDPVSFTFPSSSPVRLVNLRGKHPAL
jgi:hypothetical protein